MAHDHLSKQYDQDLEALRSQVLQMGGLVESQVRGAIQAYSTGNLSLADKIIATEVRVNLTDAERLSYATAEPENKYRTCATTRTKGAIAKLLVENIRANKCFLSANISINSIPSPVNWEYQ